MEGLEAAEISLATLERTLRLDAEYYQKTFIFYENLLANHRQKILSTEATFLIGPFGSAYDTSNYIEFSKYRYIRGQDVKPFILKNDEPRFMREHDFFELNKYALKENDILVSVVGTLGNVCLVQRQDTPAIFSCKSTVIRTKKIKPTYIVAYFNSRYGRALLLRKERGAIQKGLNLDDLRDTNIPIFSDTLEESIDGIFWKAQRASSRAKKTSNIAESILLNHLNLEEWQPSETFILECKLANVKSFKESFGATGRLDAEYYQAKYDELEAKIAETHTLGLLRDFVTINQRGTQPNYAEEGLPVINSKHVREGEVLLSDDNRFAILPDKDDALTIKKGDVLINGTGVGTIGRSAPYLHEQEAIPDNHVTILRTDKIDPIFLSVYLNSIAGKYQVEKYFKGSSGQIELYPTDIGNFYVPIVKPSIQIQIADFVRQSFMLKAKSEQLLEAAKRAVEIAIENSEEAAMHYLEPFLQDNK